MSECKTIPAFSTIFDECTVMCDCQKSIGETLMTEISNKETLIFKSRKNFRTFISEEGKSELEKIIGSNIHFLSVAEESTEEQPDILAVMNVHEKTVIECELKQSIKALSNLLKHAAGHSAKNIIWLVNQESPDAIKTADWLIRIISHEIRLYVIKCYLNDDKICFKELLRPSANSYQKPKAKITNTKAKQEEFWQEFQKYTEENDCPIKISHPAPQHWQYITIGLSGVSIQLTINTTKNYLGCELLIANDKDLFYKLEGFKEDIEKHLGNLDWQALEGKKSSRIRATKDFNLEDKDYKKGIIWLIGTTSMFKEIFTPYLA
ncbi:MAG: DUF4268 domain-containing protein [Bacteroidota bacterium]